MAGKKLPLTKTKLKTVSTSVLSTKQKNLSQGSKVLKQLTASAIATDRDKLLFLLLCASASEKAKLASYFFEDLPKRLAIVGGRMNLSPKGDFNFANWEAFAEHVKG